MKKKSEKRNKKKVGNNKRNNKRMKECKTQKVRCKQAQKEIM